MAEARAKTPICSDADEWTPIRDGDVYCSPRCGFRCTWQAYQDAVAGANALCALLGGPGEWKPCVWENLGWHYEATRGDARVSYAPKKKHQPGRHPKFSAWLTTTIHRAGGTHSLAYCAEHNEDPRTAVYAALALWRADLDAAEREYARLLAGTAPPGAILPAATVKAIDLTKPVGGSDA